MISYKWILFVTMGLFLIMDIIGESTYSVVAVFLGWLIGLMTMAEWNMRDKGSSVHKRESENQPKNPQLNEHSKKE